MDAPDVAMTETALGACLSTCVLLNIIKIVGDDVGKPKKIKIIMSAILCIIFIICLSWASLDLPEFGAENSPLQQHLTSYYIENTKNDIAIPSIVAAILSSYRGYDTLGETTVILIAGLAVLVIVSRRKEPNA
jgi:multicomponent Na+:H+ antiporter subunit B